MISMLYKGKVRKEVESKVIIPETFVFLLAGSNIKQYL